MVSQSVSDSQSVGVRYVASKQKHTTLQCICYPRNEDEVIVVVLEDGLAATVLRSVL